MKMNVEINLDWLDEEMTFDEAIKDEIMNEVSRKLSVRIENDMKNKVNVAVEKTISEKVKEIEIASSEFIDKICADRMNDIQIPYKTSTWSDEVNYMPLPEYIGQIFDQSMANTKVDKDGRIARWSSDEKTTLLKYITEGYLKKELNEKVVNMIQAARKDAEESIIETLETTLRDQLSVDIIERLNIPKMLETLQSKSLEMELE